MFQLDSSVPFKQKSLSDYMRQAQQDSAAQEERRINNEFQRQYLEIAKEKSLYEKMKAQEIDADKLGEKAFLKAAQGIELTPQEEAALQYIDAKSPTHTFNPVTGAMEQKPSLLDRAGLNRRLTDRIAPSSPAIVPPRAESASAPRITLQDKITKPATDPIVSEDDFEALNKAAMEKELRNAAGNPKLQQTIKEKYAANNAPGTKFEHENKLRDEYNQITKDYRSVQDAWSKIQTVSDTPAGDLSLIYATAKLNDPGSVVREQDFVQQAKAGSLGDRIQNMVNQVSTGNRLTAEQRKNLIAEAGLQYNAAKQGNQKTIENYTGIAKRNGLNIKNVITDYSQPNVMPNTTDATPASDPYAKAQAAIAAGAPRDAVLRRLQESGYDPAGLK
jgi:hypothetical protein